MFLVSMKKAVFFSVIFHITSLSLLFSQENLIRDGLIEDTNFWIEETSLDFPEKGIWFPYIDKDESLTIGTGADEYQGMVIDIQTSSTSSIKSFIGQRIETQPVAGIYTVRFSAKTMGANTDRDLIVYLKIKSHDTGEDVFFKSVLPNETFQNNVPSHFRALKINNFWDFYEIDFDLSKVVRVSLDNCVSKNKVEDFTEKYLEDFYIAFTCSNPNTHMRVTEVSMSLKE